jgi:hypothetical protein
MPTADKLENLPAGRKEEKSPTKNVGTSILKSSKCF